MSISKSKISLIHIAQKKLCLSDQQYRDLLWGVAQVESSKDLDNEGFDKVMKRFADLGFKSTYKKSQFGRRRGMATPEQVQYIRHLWKRYTGEYNEVSLNHWINNSFNVSSLRFIDKNMVNKVITGLKAINQRQARTTTT